MHPDRRRVVPSSARRPLPLLLIAVCWPLLIHAALAHTSTPTSVAVDPLDSPVSLPFPVMVRLPRPLHLPFRSLLLAHPLLLPPPPTPPSPPSPPQTTSPPTPSSSRLPTVFVSHGGGPSFFVSDLGHRLADIGPGSAAFHALQAVPQQLHLTPPTQPKAILVVSAHWETDGQVHINTRGGKDGLFYDYFGFPASAYKLQFPAPGSPSLASRVHELLSAQGIPSRLDGERKWDHGVFIPLKVMFPAADVPVVEMSLLSSLNPSTHLSIGRALAPLRDEGVLIVGSGFITHNFHPQGDARPFVDAVEQALAVAGNERWRRLAEWRKMPASRHAHAREEHLMPLHVVAGAGGDDPATVLGRLWVMGGEACSAHYAFGEVQDVTPPLSS